MTQFIAEICSNHNGNLDRALALIETARKIGCDGVKFQLFRVDQLFAPELRAHPDFPDLEMRRRWELPLAWLPQLAAACQELDLLFGCTPFYLEAVAELAPYVDFFKVASYELLWTELLAKILADTDKHVFMSCGMATMAEIKATIYKQAVDCWEVPERITLLHCISQYPAKPEDCHLSFIDRLRSEINIAGVGYSDHSVKAGVIQRAIHRWGAQVVEFHLDLDDKEGDEYIEKHCWTVSQMQPVIQQVNDGLAADGGWRYDPTQNSERHFRADPDDGLRPMRYMRERL